jgi:hypothetical protein
MVESRTVGRDCAADVNDIADRRRERREETHG